MLLQAARHRTLVLAQYHAPLISRVLPTSTANFHARKSAISPKNDTFAVLDKLKQQITLIHSPHGRGVSDPHTDIFNSTLVRIRQALKDNNVQAVIEYWQYLEQKELLHFLGPPQLEMISGLLAKSFSVAHDKLMWSSSSRELVEEIALLAATGRSTDALNACMLDHIKHNDPDAVIVLYERFMKSLGKQDVWADSTVDEEMRVGDNAALAVDERPLTSPIPHLPGRVALLLAVTTAHAMRDSFEAALQTCLMTVVRFNHSTTSLFLGNLTHDLALRKKVELYVKRLNIARMVARPPSLSKQITNLSTAPTLKPLENLYQAIVDGLSEPGAYLAADPSAVTYTKSVALTEVGWTSFLVAFLKCHRRDLASKVWNDMAQFGIHPGVSMWTALLDAYDSLRCVDEAVAGWDMMQAQGIRPDGLTYRALISTYFHGQKPEEAMKMFQTFRKEFMRECPAPQILSVYNTVLHGLLAVDRVDEADALMRSMDDEGPKPDLVSYNTFLAYYARRSNFQALAALVNKITSANLTGDVFSFSIILSALLKVGRDDAADMLLSIMQKQGVQPNVATFSAIIDHQMRERDEKNLRAAMRILYLMEQDASIHPNEVTYTSILAGLYRGQWLSVDKAEEWRRDIVDRMKNRGIKFNLPTYHILIKACLDYPHPVGLQNALTYYREMVKRKVPLAQTTWYILLAGLLQRGEWAVANRMIGEMYKLGAQPGRAVLELVSRIRKRTVR